MRKSIILVIALMVSALTFAQQEAAPEVQEEPTRDFTTLKALSWGIGFPIEVRDLPGMGESVNIGYDCAYPVNDHFALGFYLSGGLGYWSEFKKYSNIDHTHINFRLTAGLMMAIGDLQNKPFLLGVAPFTGFGLYDVDMTLPVEVRFGRYLNHRWYLMGQLTYHVSLAAETAVIEPAITVGCNFGRKNKKQK